MRHCTLWINQPLTGNQCLSLDGRVEMWRGSSRFCLSVAASFIWRCPNRVRLNKRHKSQASPKVRWFILKIEQFCSHKHEVGFAEIGNKFVSTLTAFNPLFWFYYYDICRALSTHFRRGLHKSFIGFISDRYCELRGLTNDTIDLNAKIALLYEPLRRSIFNTNSLFFGRKSRAV